MIDFTSLPKRKKAYAGANGSKISVVYENELYMLKFLYISLDNIQSIVQDTPFISPLQKTFYQTMIEQRYEKILLPAYELAMEHQAENTWEAEVDPEDDFEL